VKFNEIKTNVNRRTRVYLSSCPCKYFFTLINSTTFVLDNIKTTTPLEKYEVGKNLMPFLWLSMISDKSGDPTDNKITM
jgi:hypothetical protein